MMSGEATAGPLLPMQTRKSIFAGQTKRHLAINYARLARYAANAAAVPRCIHSLQAALAQIVIWKCPSRVKDIKTRTARVLVASSEGYSSAPLNARKNIL